MQRTAGKRDHRTVASAVEQIDRIGETPDVWKYPVRDLAKAIQQDVSSPDHVGPVTEFASKPPSLSRFPCFSFSGCNGI